MLSQLPLFFHEHTSEAPQVQFEGVLLEQSSAIFAVFVQSYVHIQPFLSTVPLVV